MSCVFLYSFPHFHYISSCVCLIFIKYIRSQLQMTLTWFVNNSTTILVTSMCEIYAHLLKSSCSSTNCFSLKVCYIITCLAYAISFPMSGKTPLHFICEFFSQYLVELLKLFDFNLLLWLFYHAFPVIFIQFCSCYHLIRLLDHHVLSVWMILQLFFAKLCEIGARFVNTLRYKYHEIDRFLFAVRLL